MNKLNLWLMTFLETKVGGGGGSFAPEIQGKGGLMLLEIRTHSLRGRGVHIFANPVKVTHKMTYMYTL